MFMNVVSVFLLQEENFNDDDEEGEETEGSIDQETGSMFGSLLDADVSGPDPSYEARSQASTPSAIPLLCPSSQPQVIYIIGTDLLSLISLYIQVMC